MLHSSRYGSKSPKNKCYTTGLLPVVWQLMLDMNLWSMIEHNLAICCEADNKIEDVCPDLEKMLYDRKDMPENVKALADQLFNKRKANPYPELFAHLAIIDGVDSEAEGQIADLLRLFQNPKLLQ